MSSSLAPSLPLVTEWLSPADKDEGSPVSTSCMVESSEESSGLASTGAGSGIGGTANVGVGVGVLSVAGESTAAQKSSTGWRTSRSGESNKVERMSRTLVRGAGSE